MSPLAAGVATIALMKLRSLAVVLGAATAACASTTADLARSDERVVESAPSPSEAPSSAARTPPPSATPSSVDPPPNPAGRAAYQRACADCHDSPWRVSRGPGLYGIGRAEAYVREKIRNGSGFAPGMAQRMPAIGPDVLPDAELEVLVEFLRSIKTIAK